MNNDAQNDANPENDVKKIKFGPVDFFIAAALVFAGIFIFRRFEGKAENVAQTREIIFQF
jgi:hypothetical protein